MNPMTGVHVTDGKGRKVAVLIDLKKYGARLEDFWDGLISESRRKEVGIPLEKVKADLVKRGLPRPGGTPDTSPPLPVAGIGPKKEIRAVGTVETQKGTFRASLRD
jgi:hypothetical protein